jgi:NADPH2:quinone reductase
LPVPQPKANEAVVKIAAAGINFIDVYNREGRYKAPLPLVLGQEAAGVVSAVGSDVREVAVGDPRGLHHVTGELCRVRRGGGGPTGEDSVGSGEREAAAAMLQGMTAHYLSYDTYPLKKGETALGSCGGRRRGLLLVQMAHNIGVRVIATVSTEEKAKLARAAGADEVILYTQADFEVETKRLMGGKGMDVVYDSVGKTTFDKGLNLLRPRGMMVLYGGSSGAVAPIDPLVLTQKGSIYLTRPSLGSYIATCGVAAAGGSGVWHDSRREAQVADRACVSAGRRAAGAPGFGRAEDDGEAAADAVSCVCRFRQEAGAHLGHIASRYF